MTGKCYVATPHLTETEDEYQGYYIPAGTTVLANTWHVFLAS